MPEPKKRYAQVGCGGRSGMYTKAIVERYSETAELVAICDVNRGRMAVKNEQINIWDSMSVAVRYRGGAVMNYFLLSYRSIDSGKAIKIADLLGDAPCMEHR